MLIRILFASSFLLLLILLLIALTFLWPLMKPSTPSSLLPTASVTSPVCAGVFRNIPIKSVFNSIKNIFCLFDAQPQNDSLDLLMDSDFVELWSSFRDLNIAAVVTFFFIVYEDKNNSASCSVHPELLFPSSPCAARLYCVLYRSWSQLWPCKLTLYLNKSCTLVAFPTCNGHIVGSCLWLRVCFACFVVH